MEELFSLPLLGQNHFRLQCVTSQNPIGRLALPNFTFVLLSFCCYNSVSGDCWLYLLWRNDELLCWETHFFADLSKCSQKNHWLIWGIYFARGTQPSGTLCLWQCLNMLSFLRKLFEIDCLTCSCWTSLVISKASNTSWRSLSKKERY